MGGCAALSLTACVTTNDNRVGYCESGASGQIRVFSSYCDGQKLICAGRGDQFQSITIANQTPVAVALDLTYSDGSSETLVLPASNSHRVEKPLGTSVKMVAQC